MEKTPQSPKDSLDALYETLALRRLLRIRLFLGSTVEEINTALEEFLDEQKVCVGNYVESKLHKLGSVYQLVLIYAELT